MNKQPESPAPTAGGNRLPSSALLGSVLTEEEVTQRRRPRSLNRFVRPRL
jgi:hypothetical protein